MTDREAFFAAVAAEVEHAYTKHGREQWGRHEFYGVMKEEVDEIWDAIKHNESDGDLAREIVQVAAMCLRFIETGDRYAAPVKIDQRPNGCTLACLATLTGIPLDEFKHPPDDSPLDWMENFENRAAIATAMRDTLQKHGWFMTGVWKNAPVGFAIAGGESPRGIIHSVVVKDGELWHDPHPSRAGLVRVDGYDILVRLA